MSDELCQRIGAYLDGDLSPDDSRAVERELLRPEAQRALAEELLLREFLRTQPPDRAPAGLCDRISEALEAELEHERQRRPERGAERAAERGAERDDGGREPGSEGELGRGSEQRRSTVAAGRHGARELARAALSAAGWMVRGATMSVREQGRPLRPVLAGFSTSRYVLGPLTVRRKAQPPRRPWWRRALGQLGRTS
jgi:hypothetical protein